MSPVFLAGMEKDVEASPVLPRGVLTTVEKPSDTGIEKRKRPQRAEITSSSEAPDFRGATRASFPKKGSPLRESAHGTTQPFSGVNGNGYGEDGQEDQRPRSQTSRGEGRPSSSSATISSSQGDTADSAEAPAQQTEKKGLSEGRSNAPAAVRRGAKPVKGPRPQGGRKKKKRQLQKAPVNPFAPKLKPLSPTEELLPLTEEFNTKIQVMHSNVIPVGPWSGTMSLPSHP